jgi:hypothetical protein
LNILNLASYFFLYLTIKIIIVAKSAKKSPAKTAKKAVKKAAPKAVKRPLKKAAKKIVKRPAKKLTRQPLKKAAKKSEAKPVTRPGKRFLIIYHAPMDAMAQTAEVSPEQQAAGMALWNAWADRVADNLVDLGAPLVNGKRLTAEGSSTPSDKDVSGYSLLQAEDWEEVMNLINGHPHLSGWHPEATIEIHETMLMPEM